MKFIEFPKDKARSHMVYVNPDNVTYVEKAQDGATYINFVSGVNSNYYVKVEVPVDEVLNKLGEVIN